MNNKKKEKIEKAMKKYYEEFEKLLFNFSNATAELEKYKTLKYKQIGGIEDRKRYIGRIKEQLECFIAFLLKQRQEILDDIDNMLISSLPQEAENLHYASQIGSQSSAVLKNFLKKLKSYEK